MVKKNRCFMEAYLNKGIKEIILKIPEVATVLDNYGIGCVPCSVGSCALKDVVEIHNLPEEQEQEMMYRIEKAIYPEKDIKKPVYKKTKKQVTPKEITYSPPLKKLVNEHALIKRLLALIPKITEGINLDLDIDRQLISDSLDFIQFYADKYHHTKEEEILFKYFDEDVDIIKIMFEDHATGRNHVTSIIDALEKKDQCKMVEHMIAYKDLLSEHIKKEDEILYPWIDRNLSTRQVGELFSRFNDADQESGEEVSIRYGCFITALEEQFQNNNQ